ncbi:2-hydroxyacyl-CoA dehydratase [Oribacterium sp. HCP28S3_H8]|uniref:2-hydroxyacyl-CoA dehydratase n=1 Tax=Oribacterium sp. HCP28S3_H8 TaxID=3438945 RepID=UPI003F8C9B45
MSIRDCALQSDAFCKLKHAYDNREEAASAFRKRGGKVIAELGCDIPDEMIIGAGMMPIRIYAEAEKPLIETNQYLEFSFDPIVRAQFKKIVDGTYASQADAIAISNSTDVVIRAYLYLREVKRVEPHKNIPDIAFLDWLFTRELIYQQRNEFVVDLFKNDVERWSGKKLSEDDIRAGARICNADKDALRRIGDLRHGEDIRINGSEALVIIGSAFFMDRSEHAALVQEVAEEAKSWPVICDPRVFYTGSNQEDTRLYDLIESKGLVIVGEDTDWGDRYYDRNFNFSYTTKRAIVDTYMLREFSSKKSFVSQRVEALNREVAKTHADAVIFYNNEYEESASWDYPSQHQSLIAQGKQTVYFAKMKWPMEKNETLDQRIQEFSDALKGRQKS